MSEEVERFEHAGRVVVISTDDDPMSPEEWDQAGTIVVSITDRRMGQIPTTEDREPMGRARPSWSTEARYLQRFTGALVLPLDVYADWSPSVRVRVPTDDFDGVDGIAYVTADELREEWGGDPTPAENYLRARIAELNQYLQGDVYTVTVEDGHGNMLESCGSFYGLEYAREAAREMAAGNPAPEPHQLAELLLPMEATR